MDNRKTVIAAMITAIGAIVAACIVVLGSHWSRASTSTTLAATGTPTTATIGQPPASTSVAGSTVPNTRGDVHGSLTPQEALQWCSGAARDKARFRALVEANGLVNPSGVHMTAGSPVALSIPADVSVDVWDCFRTSQATGPVRLNQVCEATFRRG